MGKRTRRPARSGPARPTPTDLKGTSARERTQEPVTATSDAQLVSSVRGQHDARMVRLKVAQEDWAAFRAVAIARGSSAGDLLGWLVEQFVVENFSAQT